jgi:ATP-binding cassette subfamily F protein uup
MVVQRGYGVTKPEVEKAPRERVARGPATSPPPQRAKLSFKHKHALETLPGEIARLEAEIARLNAELADPGLYARDPGAFAAASKKLAEAQAAKAQAEDQWLELELLREKLEG